jgi:LysM repeat protein
MTITEYYVSGSDYNRVASESVNLQKQLAVAQQEIRHLKEQITGLQAEKHEIDRIKEDIAGLSTNDNDLNSLREEIETLKTKKDDILSMKEEIEALKEKNQELENILAAYRKEIRRQDAILRSQSTFGTDDLQGSGDPNQHTDVLVRRNQELEDLVQKYKLMMMQQMSGNGLPGDGLTPVDLDRRYTADTEEFAEIPAPVVGLNWETPTALPAAEVEPGEEPYRVYIIEQGDSLWKIARKFHVRESAIRAINDIEGNLIKPGWKLKIPYNSERYSYISRKMAEKPANRPQMLR